VASQAIVDQLTPLLPKDDKQFTGKVKQLYALVETATLMNHAFVQEARKRGQETDHHRHLQSQSSSKESTSNSSSSGGGASRIMMKGTYMASSGPRTCAARLKVIDKTGTKWLVLRPTYSALLTHENLRHGGNQVVVTRFAEGDLPSKFQAIGNRHI
jgi:hypothetical protein